MYNGSHMALRGFLKQISLYRLRYIAGYAFLFMVILIVLLLDIRHLPSGVSLDEMASAVASSNLKPDWTFGWLINAPYYGLQKLSLFLFGVERWTLVLPSLIFGAATMGLFFLTMRQWFRPSIAVVSTFVALTSSPFINVLRSATPDIMLLFWTITLLYAAVKLLIKREKAFIWKLIIVLSAAGLIYTPLGIYPLVAFIVVGVLHPHIRSRLRHIRLKRKIILSIIAALAIAPMVVHLINEPSTLKTLLGIDLFSSAFGNFRGTVKTFYVSYINVMRSGFAGTLVIPAFNVASICLMLLGLFRCIKDHHTARSYALLAWTAVVTPVIFLAPTEQQLVIMPALLLMTVGIETLILDWYKLFPRNPYARIAGLIPLTILFISISVGNITHYFYNHLYITNPAYRVSLNAIQQTAKENPDTKLLLLTDSPTVKFYGLLTKRYGNLSVASEAPATQITGKTLVTPEATSKATFASQPSRILTTHFSGANGVALRVYTK